MSKQKSKTAAELIAELEADPTWLGRRRQREEEFQHREQAYSRAEAPVVKALRQAGVPVDSVWDLVNSTNRYAQSFPILLEHLRQPYPDAVREGMARALAVPSAKSVWPSLVELYRNESAPQTKDGLAVALSNIADDDVIDELVVLALQADHGESRIFLLSALERSKLPQARNALQTLTEDPTTRKQAKSILRRSK